MSSVTKHKPFSSNLLKIPKDQKELIDLDISWASSLGTRTNGFVNVPPDVVDNLKKWHGRQLQATPSDNPPSPSLPNPPGDDFDQKEEDEILSQANADPEVEIQSQVAHSELGIDDDKDDEKPTFALSRAEWQSSPPENKFPPQKTESESGQSQFLTQPHFSPTVTSMVSLPPSSQEEEEPLEMATPIAITDAAPPVNKDSSHQYATPPSPPVVPCTFQQSEQSSTDPRSEPEPKPKQRAYPEPVEFYHPGKAQSPSKHLNSLRPTDTPLANAQNATSPLNPSSLFVPSTMQDEGTSKDLPTQHSSQVTCPISLLKKSTISYKDLSSQNSSQIQQQQQSPEFKPSSPHFGSSPIDSPIHRDFSLNPIWPQPPTQSPFACYTTTYRDYRGSISDFIEACVYIQHQQKRARIRTSLYDDFIRIWHDAYRQYIVECDNADPPVKALSAIAWYNTIDDDPVYTSRVITRQNLEFTLSCYPADVQYAQHTISTLSNPTAETASCTDTTQPANNHKLGLVDNRIIPDMTQNLGVIGMETNGHDPRIVPPTSSSTFQRPENSAIIPPHKSMSVIDQRPAQGKGLARSFSEANMYKRKASEDLSGAFTKRFSVNSLVKTDTMGNASAYTKPGIPRHSPEGSMAPSSTASRKNRYENHPEKRSKAWKRYCDKRRTQWDKEGIASSAPVNNTPTSAQRE
ncbi:uncharacterized protein GGS25DRAFT_443956 [Hypoxylon fragiforme]|uniref:uncharacterized protein n=1 Tax=Hypoxylon fragiforme TaxID=63214 RepID=UPI0020C5C138|nr:uncharacterized protein GGS25DRAFT_443956 [Hypoxylon fragiforme]KAI2603983.1 hypothetical protein GGS25DRAFT_443956 [Hypoxylon fragiforme]